VHFYRYLLFQFQAGVMSISVSVSVSVSQSILLDPGHTRLLVGESQLSPSLRPHGTFI